MAKIIVTIKIMPKTVETDLKKIEEEAKKIIESFGEKLAKTEVEPIAFGLNALKLTFLWEESRGGVDPVEEKLSKIEGVLNVQVIDVRRAIG